MGLIFKIIEELSKNTNDKDSKLEKEMDLYGLEDVEKEYVRRGDYEPYNFEDSKDELDEDDYYYDNDDI